MNISKKQIVDIREFLRNYYLLDCKWKGKLSHKRMNEFLFMKGKYAVKVNIDSIKKENILRGTCIFVKDEEGQIIPYQNIARIRYNANKESTSDENENIRLRLLEEQGLTYDDYGNVITIKERQEMLEKQRMLQEEILNNILLSQLDEFYEKLAITNRQKTKRYYRGCVR